VAPPSRKFTAFTSAPLSTAFFAPAKSPSFAALHSASCASAGEIVGARRCCCCVTAPSNRTAPRPAAMLATPLELALYPSAAPAPLRCFAPARENCGELGGVGELRPEVADAKAARRTVGLSDFFALLPRPRGGLCGGAAPRDRPPDDPPRAA